MQRVVFIWQGASQQHSATEMAHGQQHTEASNSAQKGYIPGMHPLVHGTAIREKSAVDGLLKSQGPQECIAVSMWAADSYSLGTPSHKSR